jgi:2-haloacid dehalogenase
VKPDKAVYRDAERRFGVAGDRILFFDDLPDNVAAALRMGWQAMAIDHAGDTARQIEAALQRHGVL